MKVSFLLKLSIGILLGSLMISGDLGVYAQECAVNICVNPRETNLCTGPGQNVYTPGGTCTINASCTRTYCEGTPPPATNCEGKTGAEKETCEQQAAKKTCDPSKECCGIKLNTNVPFIGNCIEYSKDGEAASSNANTTTVNSLNAFPLLLGGLSRILLTVILVGSFVMVIAAGVMMAAPDSLGGSFSNGQSIIWRVIAGIALLGASGIILNAINPNFFK